MENRRSIAAIRSQVLQQPAVSPTKEGLFGGSGKKTAGAARNHTRKALADKTNESSPTSSGFTPSPMKLKEGDRVSYKGTPYPKLLHDVQKVTVPPPVLNKVETAEEYSLHRMPKTPGELVAPTPANTPISSILPFSSSSLSRRALPTTPSSVFTFAPPVFEDKPDVPMSPNQDVEEEALNAYKSKIKAEPIPANKPIVVSSSFDHSVLCPTTALPAVCDKKTDVTVLSSQQGDDLNADDDNKTHGGDSPTAAPQSSSSVQCTENRQWEEGTGGEDGELLPLDLQLLYMFGKASYVPSPSDEEEEADDADDESCLTEPDELDINVLQHLEKVLWNLEQNPKSSATGTSDVSSTEVMTTSSTAAAAAAWVGRDVEDVTVDDDVDDDDDNSECSVVVNLSSSPRMQRDSSNNDEIDEEAGFEEYNNYYEKEENDYEDYENAGEELDGACDELCYAISQFTINEKDGVGLPTSKGQHVRFNYNSDDEMEGEIVVTAEPPAPPHQESPSIVRLKGLPTPKGKHLRFTEEITDSPSV
ncbi:unnamed protein product [Sphagnum troendelagicum]|uniref:Uncharacterized protein n=1 Tax=Sphagnum troendelagicum TaxID=128251 RepID=A0ABP0TNK3_9BRYO